MSRFQPKDVVWAKNAFRRNAYWPAIVVDAEIDAPLSVRKCAVSGRCCLMFYGPSKTSNRSRDWYWREVDDILPWATNLEKQKSQQLSVGEQFAFNRAILEAQGVISETKRNLKNDPRSPQILRTNHSTTLDHGLTRQILHRCTICQKTQGTMMVCCKCNARVHVNCDLLAIIPARAEVKGIDCVYYCATCRGGLDSHEIERLSMDYGRELQTLNSSSLMMNFKSEGDKRVEFATSLESKGMELNEPNQLYSKINGEYMNLIEQYQQSDPSILDFSENGNQKRKYVKTCTLKRRSVEYGLMENLCQIPSLPPSDIKHSKSVSNPTSPLRKQRKLEESGKKEDVPGSSSLMVIDKEVLEKDIPVVCNGNFGIFHFNNQKVTCECEECMKKPEHKRLFTATHFEQHCGAGTAKKWKASVRIRPGSVPEVPASDPPLPLGRWFAMKGLDMLITRVSVSSKRDGPSRPSLKHRSTQVGSFKEFEQQVSQVEVKPWDYVRVGGYIKLHVRYAGDRCSVCDADVDYDCDQLISCDKCGIAVHQTCYGVHEAMSNDKVWLCNVCRAQGTENAECCLCPIAEGARKPTTIDGLWCHVACMQWIPEVTVENPLKMERISRVEYIQKERWELNCCFCKQKMGAKIQCATCYTAYHPLCARIAGMHMEMKDGPEGSSGPLDLVTYCPRHAKPHPELSGIKLVLDQEEDCRLVLCNRQPYVEPPAVEIPQSSSGCARAQALENWERKSHGCGSGFGSVKGFWIPEKPPFITPGSWKHYQSMSMGGSRGKKGRSDGSFFNKRAGDESNEVPLPVDLLDLPEGVKEEVKVECNGISAVFIVRSQRVLHLGQSIPAAKFEQLCGRGDAKKWKASLWFVNEQTNKPECQMHVWLSSAGLDRNVLAKLQTNQTEYDAYQSYINDQVSTVLDEVVESVIKEQEPDKEQEIPEEKIEQLSPARKQSSSQHSAVDSEKEEMMEIEEDSKAVKEDGGHEESPEWVGQHPAGEEEVKIEGEDKMEYEDGGLLENAEERILTDSDLCWDGEKEKWNHPGSEITSLIKETEEVVDDEIPEENGVEEKSTPEKTIPEKTEVFCNGITATFIVKEMMIISNEGLKMTPRDFERAAGKGASKKWKNSIKVKRLDGRGYMTVGDWLSKNGCVSQKSSTGGLTRTRGMERTRKSASRVRDFSWIVPKHRRQRHQAGCLCIVCRQSKRRANNSGLTGRLGPTNPQKVEPWQPATTLASVRAQGPGIRHGKRAYIQALPHLVGGATRHELHEIPPSRCWSAEKWLLEAKKITGVWEESQNSVLVDPLKGILCKSEKWQRQLKQCRETDSQRLTFGKSGIHGWGLFSLVNHPQDTMIIEYKGEIVTPAVADLRETLYREKGMDCYLFHVTDTFIIDATVKGAIGRFINHCCAPSMYAKAIQVEGRSHLCFFARYNIKAGQELTYDYRFKEEIGENKLPCHCGAPNCRGYLN